MRPAISPFLATGVALVGAAAIVANPVVPPPPDISVSAAEYAASGSQLDVSISISSRRSALGKRSGRTPSGCWSPCSLPWSRPSLAPMWRRWHPASHVSSKVTSPPCSWALLPRHRSRTRTRSMKSTAAYSILFLERRAPSMVLSQTVAPTRWSSPSPTSARGSARQESHSSDRLGWRLRPSSSSHTRLATEPWRPTRRCGGCSWHRSSAIRDSRATLRSTESSPPASSTGVRCVDGLPPGSVRTARRGDRDGRRRNHQRRDGCRRRRNCGDGQLCYGGCRRADDRAGDNERNPACRGRDHARRPGKGGLGSLGGDTEASGPSQPTADRPGGFADRVTDTINDFTSAVRNRFGGAGQTPIRAPGHPAAPIHRPTARGPPDRVICRRRGDRRQRAIVRRRRVAG